MCFVWGSLIFYLSLIGYTDSLQCYSCKKSGTNEIAANIRCLENAYLENCDDFYNYYDEVDNTDGLLYDYDYYYNYQDKNSNGKSRINSTKGKKKQSDKGSKQNEVLSSKDRERNSKTKTKATEKPQTSSKKETGPTEADSPEDVEYVYEYIDITNETDPELLKAAYGAQGSGLRSKRAAKKKANNEEYEYYEQEVEMMKTTTRAPSVQKHAKQTTQHHCYSVTVKNSWESYTVEKGCKKMSYCKELKKKNPEWGNPWNFCCDRSRCNAKLVKDKPQRIFAMGCRRTDDCIQGHNTRAVCPNYFKSCPRLSSGLIKMECRVKARNMASVKNVNKYRNLFREKKCYCTKGHYPKGPVCTNKSASIQGVFSLIVSNCLLLISTLILTKF